MEMPKQFDNLNSKVVDDLKITLKQSSKVSIAAASFSIYAYEALKCSGKIYSEQHRRNFDIKDDILRVENDPDDESRLNLTINRKPIADWFREQWHRLRYGARVPQQEERKSRGFKL